MNDFQLHVSNDKRFKNVEHPKQQFGFGSKCQVSSDWVIEMVSKLKGSSFSPTFNLNFFLIDGNPHSMGKIKTLLMSEISMLNVEQWIEINQQQIMTNLNGFIEQTQ